jgi:chromosome segregation ATPase
MSLMTTHPVEPPKGEAGTSFSGGLLKSILSKLGDGVATILIAKESLAAVREQVGRLQGQLIEVIGSLNYHTGKIEALERQLAETEAENRRLRERIEAVERAQQYHAGRLDEAAKRGG